jgi:uncharacterized protein (DUF2062 family)
MFRRRKQMSVVHQVRSVVWPERGFRRLFSYLFQRVIRLPGTPFSIASGIACGVFASFTPFLGLHFILAAALALALRGNVLASAIGTFFGNPWTFVPIWLVSYEVGFELIHFNAGQGSAAQLTIDELLSVMGDIARFLTFSGKITWVDLKASLEHVLMPLLFGGVVLGIVAWLISFCLTYNAVKAWRAHRVRKLAKAAADVAVRRAQKGIRPGQTEAQNLSKQPER